MLWPRASSWFNNRRRAMWLVYTIIGDVELSCLGWLVYTLCCNMFRRLGIGAVVFLVLWPRASSTM